MSGDCISKSQNSNEIRKEVKNGKDHDAFSLLRKQRLGYPKNVIFGHLNINFMTKTLRKAIMIRSRLKNRFHKTRSDKNWLLYKTQRNLCTKLLRKTKKDYFSKLNPKLVLGNKNFWRTIKPYFSDKGNFSNKIMISEKDCIVFDNRRLSEIFNEHFINITKTLDLKPSIISTTTSLPEIIETFKDHPSIKKISSLQSEECQFKFHSVNENEVRKVILNMEEKTANLTGDIPAGILKGCVDSYIPILTKILNTSLERGCFPNQLKLAKVTPVFKKEDELNKENYRPVSVLSHASKIFERMVFNQMNLFFESMFSPQITGFRKNHSTQNALLNMIEKWRHALDKGKKVGTIFMDLSKAFDTLNHNLLLAKLDAYGFSFNAIKFVQSYLSERFQRVNINNNFSEWCKILLGVPQGSIVGPLLFNIFINDIFYFIQDAYICNFADDNSLYSIEDNLKEVKTILKKNFEILQWWFYENYMVLNPGKCHYLIINNDIINTSIELGEKVLYAEAEQKLLGIIIDKDLNFQSHTKSIIKTANQKLSALIRVAPFMTDFNKKVILNPFFKGQFNYCPLLWMFSTRKVNHKINRLHERGLRALLNDEASTFNDMLSKSNDTTIHVKNIQKLMIEFYKYLYGLSAPIMKEVFTKRILKYNLRNCRENLLPNPKTKKYGTDTVAYKASQLWSTLPTRYKNLSSLDLFKSEIKTWNCNDCPCNICRIFVDGVGFIN